MANEAHANNMEISCKAASGKTSWSSCTAPLVRMPTMRARRTGLSGAVEESDKTSPVFQPCSVASFTPASSGNASGSAPLSSGHSPATCQNGLTAFCPVWKFDSSATSSGWSKNVPSAATSTPSARSRPESNGAKP